MGDRQGIANACCPCGKLFDTLDNLMHLKYGFHRNLVNSDDFLNVFVAMGI
jgi:hypothetical protein